MTLALAVAGLVLVLQDVIFGPLAASTTSAVTLTLASCSASLVTVPPSTSEQRRAASTLSPALAADLVDHEDVADGDLLLAATSAHDRVHVSYSLSLRERSLGNRLMWLPLTTRDIGSVGAPTVKTTGGSGGRSKSATRGQGRGRPRRPRRMPSHAAVPPERPRDRACGGRDGAAGSGSGSASAARRPARSVGDAARARRRRARPPARPRARRSLRSRSRRGSTARPSARRLSAAGSTVSRAGRGVERGLRDRRELLGRLTGILVLVGVLAGLGAAQGRGVRGGRDLGRGRAGRLLGVVARGAVRRRRNRPSRCRSGPCRWSCHDGRARSGRRPARRRHRSCRHCGRPARCARRRRARRSARTCSEKTSSRPGRPACGSSGPGRAR